VSGEPWLTKRELARKLRISTRTIERLDLPRMCVGGQNRYLMSEVRRYLRGDDVPENVIVLRPRARGRSVA
jgi:hypothetical protein